MKLASLFLLAVAAFAQPSLVTINDTGIYTPSGSLYTGTVTISHSLNYSSNNQNSVVFSPRVVSITKGKLATTLAVNVSSTYQLAFGYGVTVTCVFPLAVTVTHITANCSGVGFYTTLQTVGGIPILNNLNGAMNVLWH